jgi:hypothetical protein
MIVQSYRYTKSKARITISVGQIAQRMGEPACTAAFPSGLPSQNFFRMIRDPDASSSFISQFSGVIPKAFPNRTGSIPSQERCSGTYRLPLLSSFHFRFEPNQVQG